MDTQNTIAYILTALTFIFIIGASIKIISTL